MHHRKDKQRDNGDHEREAVSIFSFFFLTDTTSLLSLLAFSYFSALISVTTELPFTQTLHVENIAP